MTATEIIKREMGNSKNFMTPTVLKYGKIISNIAFELSKGTGFYHNLLVGVTIVLLKRNNTTTRHLGLSKSFQSFNEAENYISNLKTYLKLS